MKTFILLAFLAAGLQLGAQNLIENPSFDQGDLNINCSKWVNGCGDPLADACTETGACMVHFEQDSPSMIPEDRWCVALTAGFPHGTVMYSLTGLEGTISFRADAWIKSNTDVQCMGFLSLGITENGMFNESKNTSGLTDDWTQISLYDTIQLADTDSLTLILASTVGDFIFEEVLFDLVNLEIVETLQVEEAFADRFSWIYDPEKDVLKIDSKQEGDFSAKLVELNGREVKRLDFRDEAEFSLQHLRNGLYVLQVEGENGALFSEKIVKY